MESMTGYAYLEKSISKFSFSVEIKSLNSKYFETHINLPRILRIEEIKINSLLKKSFERGKIEFSIEIFNWQEAKPTSLNEELMKKYFKELKKISTGLGINSECKLDSLLMLDGIINRERAVIDKDSLKEIYLCIKKAIEKTLEMRLKETISIEKDILNSIKFISNNAGLIKKISGQSVQAKQENLKKRINMLAGYNIENDRLYSEIAILADKLDINEELVRLNDHIDKFKNTIKIKGQIGKILDFLSQEMFREINTISSKSNSSEIAHASVEVKNHIDKIREHCRNIV
jgi:uncharacterized protein (TIGR00255 family)